VSSQQYVESVERVIAAPPERIFDLVADPSRHAEIDGGGTVRDATEGSRRLALGDTFGMSMKAGIGYSMANTVVEFDDNRRIAWRPETTGRMGSFLGGRIWRYELEPVEGGRASARPGTSPSSAAVHWCGAAASGHARTWRPRWSGSNRSSPPEAHAGRPAPDATKRRHRAALRVDS